LGAPANENVKKEVKGKKRGKYTVVGLGTGGNSSGVDRANAKLF